MSIEGSSFINNLRLDLTTIMFPIYKSANIAKDVQYIRDELELGNFESAKAYYKDVSKKCVHGT